MSHHAAAADRRQLRSLVPMVAAVLAIAIWLFLRNDGLYPAIFPDEWYYSKMARLIPLSESLLPSYLYLWLFSASNMCGADFLDCVRIGNLILFIGALPFLYWTGRCFTRPAYASLFTVLAALAPLNLYTSFFMPETTYYFGFCVLSWIMLTRTGWHWGVHALAGGAVLGAMGLVKVHALFLLPALCLFLVHAAWLRGGAWFGRAAGAVALTIGMAALVKFGLGWLLAGPAGLSLFGPFYSGTLSESSAAKGAALMEPIAVSALGHLMALALLMGLPLALLLHGVATSLPRSVTAPARPLHVYMLLMLGASLGMTVLYTASLAHIDAYEGVRLHLRYYNFLFPLLWLVAAACVDVPPAGKPAWRWLIAAILILLVLAAIKSLPTYAMGLIDGPDIGAISIRQTSGHITIVLQLVLLVAWAVGRLNPARLFLIGLLPITLLVTAKQESDLLAARRIAEPGERAAALVLKIVPRAEQGRIAIAGTDAPQILRAQFHIDHPDTLLVHMKENAPVAAGQIPAGYRWLLVMGRHAEAPGVVVRSEGKLTLLRLP